MLDLTLEEVIGATGAELVGKLPEHTTLFPPVSIDTRTLQSEEAFFAIKGEQFDGHSFVEEAFSKGASIVVASDSTSLPPIPDDATLLLVKNTTAALQNLAHYARRSWGGPVLAITGSMGKTTTRVFTATLLGERFNVLQSPANFNNEFGVPLSLLKLKMDHDMAVLELGMNHPGEIRKLGRICLPDKAVITNVAPVHLEFFDGVDEIAQAKEEVLEYLTEGGVFFANEDDRRVREMADRYPAETVTFGFSETADFRVTYCGLQSPTEMEFEIKTPDQYFRASVPFAGKHLMYNIAAAVAVATVSGLSWRDIDAGLGLLRTLPKRGQLLRLERLTIWDESYNSNPVAAECLLETVSELVSELPGFGRTILTLGDMLELGKDSPALHYELGQKVAKLSPQKLVTVGNQSLQIQDGAIESGMPQSRCIHFQNASQAADYLQEHLESGDLLVLKGSRGIELDRIVDQIRRARV